MTERLKGWKTVILGLMAAGFIVSLAGCGETPKTSAETETTALSQPSETSQPSESSEMPESDGSSSELETSQSLPPESSSSQLSPPAENAPDVLETDDGTFYAVIDDYYSDTHYTEVTVRIGRLDGTPLNQEREVYGEMTEPNNDSRMFYEFANMGGDKWYQDGAYFARYRIYSNPAHTRLSFSYTNVDLTPTELDLSFTPESVPRKVAGEMEFPDGMILQSAMVAERSGLMIFYLPEEQAVSYETDEAGVVIGRSVQPASVNFSALDGDGGVLWEKEGFANTTGNDRQGYVKFAYHLFFDEDDPLPLDEAATIVLNGNEIPLTESAE